MLPAFCSRDERYKNPFGALPAGDKAVFRIFIAERPEEPARAAFLHLLPDGIEDIPAIPMEPDGEEENGRWWRCEAAPDTGLYWYFFSFKNDRAVYWFSREVGGYAAVAEGEEPPAEEKRWQLTVYDRDFTTPDWLSGGILYQIFPDRFYRSGRPHIQPADRCLREDWGGRPAYRMDGSPCHLGNDYFGGDLKGIEEKLPYLKDLGVSCIYLNPIFEAHANHRYNTADYLAVDPGLGEEGDFRRLCAKAAEAGIRIILDGVFSHTGDDSRYFNRKHRYPELGAYNSTVSPYYSWFKFEKWPDKYRSWWGIDTLPETEEDDPSFLDFITGPDGVLRRWMRQGAAGWRLDVADELPDVFLDAVRAAVKDEKADGLVLGEVWEDASNKISYGARRRYLQGGQLDSVMNYPFRDAILAFLTGGDAWKFMEAVMTLLENYPAPVVRVLMNHVGTHDTPRLLNVLGGPPMAGKDREWQAARQLTSEERQKGLRLQRLAALLQFTLPGVPCIYYGDEVGMEGYGDPFNRGCFPWDSLPDAAAEPEGLPAEGHILDFYRALGRLRRQAPAFDGGAFIPVFAETGHLAYIREKGDSRVFVAVNRWCDAEPVTLPGPAWETARVLAGPSPVGGQVLVPGEGFSVLVL